MEKPMAIATATASSSTTALRRTGLVNQGWKDSGRFQILRRRHAVLGAPPVARVGAGLQLRGENACCALLARYLGFDCRAQELARQAELSLFREPFRGRVLVPEELGSYALALDGLKRPCLVADPATLAKSCAQRLAGSDRQAASVADLMMSPRLFSGWGVRTSRRFTPLSVTIRCRITTAPSGHTTTHSLAHRSGSVPTPGRCRPDLIKALLDAAMLDGPASLAGIVLRLQATAWLWVDALPRRLLAAGLGQRDAVHTARGFAWPRIRSVQW